MLILYEKSEVGTAANFFLAVTGLNVWMSVISVGVVCTFYTALVSTW